MQVAPLSCEGELFALALADFTQRRMEAVLQTVESADPTVHEDGHALERCVSRSDGQVCSTATCKVLGHGAVSPRPVGPPPPPSPPSSIDPAICPSLRLSLRLRPHLSVPLPLHGREACTATTDERATPGSATAVGERRGEEREGLLQMPQPVTQTGRQGSGMGRRETVTVTE